MSARLAVLQSVERSNLCWLAPVIYKVVLAPPTSHYWIFTKIWELWGKPLTLPSVHNFHSSPYRDADIAVTFYSKSYMSEMCQKSYVSKINQKTAHWFQVTEFSALHSAAVVLILSKQPTMEAGDGQSRPSQTGTKVSLCRGTGNSPIICHNRAWLSLTISGQFPGRWIRTFPCQSQTKLGERLCQPSYPRHAVTSCSPTYW